VIRALRPSEHKPVRIGTTVHANASASERTCRIVSI
jgi:hypothetical protein